MTIALDYAGSRPAPSRSLLARAWGALWFVFIVALLLVYITLRATLLLAGLACVLVGTILLTLGGKRSAAQKLRQWRDHFNDLLRLWLGDILRPLRRWRSSRRPRPVLALP